jgi:hypothetical protein
VRHPVLQRGTACSNRYALRSCADCDGGRFVVQCATCSQRYKIYVKAGSIPHDFLI